MFTSIFLMIFQGTSKLRSTGGPGENYIHMPIWYVCYRRMPFGLCNVPTTFQRCMVSIFFKYVEKIIEIFMDDFSVYGDSFEKCLDNLALILK